MTNQTLIEALKNLPANDEVVIVDEKMLKVTGGIEGTTSEFSVESEKGKTIIKFNIGKIEMPESE